MKILIVTKNDRLNGVSTFIWTMAKACIDLGYEVHIKIRETTNSIVSVNLRGIGAVLVDKVDREYQQIFYNYCSDSYVSPKGIKKFVVHGIHNPDLFPSDPNFIYDTVYTLSEVVKNHLPYESDLIRNMIDPDRFSFDLVSGFDQPAKVLLVDLRNNTFLLNSVISACSYLGMYVSILGHTPVVDAARWNVEDYIQGADIVIGYGRSIIEAMHMGKAGIVYGSNGGDGFVTPEKVGKMTHTNFSGWSYRTLDKPENQTSAVDGLVRELDRVNSSDVLKTALQIRKTYSVSENLPKLLSVK